MKQEFIAIIIVGLFILAYILDAVVQPLHLTVAITNPYQYLNPALFSLYAFSTTSIVLKAIGIVLSTLYILSFAGFSKITKGSIVLAISALMQLYSLQDIGTHSLLLPFEWSLALTLGGMILLIPTVIYMMLGFFGTVHNKISPKDEVYNVNDPGYKKIDL